MSTASAQKKRSSDEMSKGSSSNVTACNCGEAGCPDCASKAKAATCDCGEAGCPDCASKAKSSSSCNCGEAGCPDCASSSSTGKKSKAVAFQPSIYTTVMPYIIMPKGKAVEAMKWYCTVFNAKEQYHMDGPDGGVMHAEIKIGTSTLMLSEENPQWGAFGPTKYGGPGVGLSVYVPDVDACVKRALDGGATIDQGKELRDEWWGDRCCSFSDPFGYNWTALTHIKEVDFAAHPMAGPPSATTDADKEKEKEKEKPKDDKPAAPVPWKPHGYIELLPYLLVGPDSVGAMAFYERVFGAKEKVKMAGPAGAEGGCDGVNGENKTEKKAEETNGEKKAAATSSSSSSSEPSTIVYHGEMQFGDTIVMMSHSKPPYLGPKALGGSSVTLCHYVKDVDAFVESFAKQPDCKIVRPPSDQFYGSRASVVEDPYGVKWNINTQVEDLTYDQIKQRAVEEMKKFAHPTTEKKSEASA